MTLDDGCLIGGPVKIIGLAGKARHGKDTAAKHIAELLQKPRFEVVRLSFADAVKAEALLHRGWNGKKDEYGRTLLQQIGQSARDRDPEHWIRIVFREIETMALNHYASHTTDERLVFVITDCRYVNEFRAVKRWGGKVWHVLRLNTDGTAWDNGLTPEQKRHPSEVEMDTYGDEWDAILGAPTVEQQRVMIKDALTQLFWNGWL